MRRSYVFLLAALPIGSCAEEPPAPVEPVPTFEEDAYAYCTAKDERWQADLFNRIEQGLPKDFSRGTLVNDWPRLFEAIIQRRISPEGMLTEEKELVLHLKADRRGSGETKLAAYGRIDPVTCRVDQLEAHVGFDRFSPDTEKFPIE